MPFQTVWEPALWGAGEWQNPLCGCFDDTDACLDSFFCPCFQLARQYDAVETNRRDNVNPLICCVTFFGAKSGMDCAANLYIRRRILKRFGIAEELYESMAIALCCSCCSLAA